MPELGLLPCPGSTEQHHENDILQHYSLMNVILKVIDMTTELSKNSIHIYSIPTARNDSNPWQGRIQWHLKGGAKCPLDF